MNLDHAEWLSELYRLAKPWVAANGPPGQGCTSAYVDLIFSFGMARCGNLDASDDLLESARQVLAAEDEVHRLLCDAFAYRIHQAQELTRHWGPLPANLLQDLETTDRLPRYILDCLRKQSLILEPHVRINPYRHWAPRSTRFDRDLAELENSNDPAAIVARVERMLLEVPGGSEGVVQRYTVLVAALGLAPYCDEAFARRVLEQALTAHEDLPGDPVGVSAWHREQFLSKGLVVSAQRWWVESASQLMLHVWHLVEAEEGEQKLALLHYIVTSCCGSLRLLGMKAEIKQILSRVTDLVSKGRVIQSGQTYDHSFFMRMQLGVAGNWYYLGREDLAGPILEATWIALLEGEPLAIPLAQMKQIPKHQTKLLGRHSTLACAHGRAASLAPQATARRLLGAFFTQLKGINDTFVTRSHYSVAQLGLLESVVLEVVRRAEAIMA